MTNMPTNSFSSLALGTGSPLSLAQSVGTATLFMRIPASEGNSDSSARNVTGTPLDLPYGTRPGYTDNVDDEYNSDPQEILLMEKPESLRGPTFHDYVFNSALSNEFLLRYQEAFGRTEQEENYFLTSSQGYYYGPNGLTATQEDQRRREFAEYMMKRLVEFHTENIMKNDPNFRKVYEIKQAMSNYSITAGPTMKLDMRYQFIGNYFVADFKHPIVNASLTVNMDPSSLMPTNPKEVYLVLSRALSRTVSGEAGYTFYDKAYRVSVTKRLAANISTNVTETLHMSDPLTIDTGREGLTLVGLNIVF